jgi:hypothetical protein
VKAFPVSVNQNVLYHTHTFLLELCLSNFFFFFFFIKLNFILQFDSAYHFILILFARVTIQTFHFISKFIHFFGYVLFWSILIKILTQIFRWDKNWNVMTLIVFKSGFYVFQYAISLLTIFFFHFIALCHQNKMLSVGFSVEIIITFFIYSRNKFMINLWRRWKNTESIGLYHLVGLVYLNNFSMFHTTFLLCTHTYIINIYLYNYL